MKFYGSNTDFYRMLKLTRVTGSIKPIQYALRFVAASGAGVNWSPNTGTMWFDGPQPARAQLQELLTDAMRQSSAAELQRRIREGR